MSADLVIHSEELQPLEIQNEVNKIFELANSLVVNNEEAFREITGLYKRAKDWEVKIEDLRKEANRADQARIDARMEYARGLTRPLQTAQMMAKQKSGAYQRDLERKKQEEIAAVTAAAALFDEETPYIQPVDKRLKGDGATVSTAKIYKFRIKEREKIPNEYLTVNEELINKLINSGLKKIDGIEIYEETITKIKRGK